MCVMTYLRRSPYGSVDLNVRDIQNSFQYSRSPCGSVDLNRWKEGSDDF